MSITTRLVVTSALGLTCWMIAASCGGEDIAETSGPVADAGPDTDAELDAELDASLPELVMPDFDLGTLEADMTALSSAPYAGRATATAGNDLALDFVEGRFAEIGLEPAGDEPGSYRQAFPYDIREEVRAALSAKK